MPCKNEFGNFWVLGRVAYYTQYLNVRRISPEAGCRTVRFDMVPLQVFLFTAFCAFATFFYQLLDGFAAAVTAFTNAVVPFMVRCTTHSSTPCRRHARNRAVFPCTAVSLPNLKMFPTLLARTIQHSFGFSWPKFLRAVSRTSVCFPPHMRVRANKRSTARGTSKGYVAAPFDLSLGF